MIPKAYRVYLQSINQKSVAASGEYVVDVELNDVILRLNQQLLIKEPGIMRFLADRIKQNNQFEELLFHLIEQSKTNEHFATAAANAISILALANVSFSMKDFRGIKISGADVSGAVFHGTDFTGADLSHVWFYRAWLKEAILKKANLTGTQFDDIIQSEQLTENITACCFATNGGMVCLS